MMKQTSPSLDDLVFKNSPPLSFSGFLFLISLVNSLIPTPNLQDKRAAFPSGKRYIQFRRVPVSVVFHSCDLPICVLLTGRLRLG
ncbi:MAG: hypothetical protein J7L99_04465 [Planctomycetes bacterium]|nr:hypothetical protein [Planctomycetota bacterium]